MGFIVHTNVSFAEDLLSPAIDAAENQFDIAINEINVIHENSLEFENLLESYEISLKQLSEVLSDSAKSSKDVAQGLLGASELAGAVNNICSYIANDLGILIPKNLEKSLLDQGRHAVSVKEGLISAAEAVTMSSSYLEEDLQKTLGDTTNTLSVTRNSLSDVVNEDLSSIVKTLEAQKSVLQVSRSGLKRPWLKLLPVIVASAGFMMAIIVICNSVVLKKIMAQ